MLKMTRTIYGFMRMDDPRILILRYFRKHFLRMEDRMNFRKSFSAGVGRNPCLDVNVYKNHLTGYQLWHVLRIFRMNWHLAVYANPEIFN